MKWEKKNLNRGFKKIAHFINFNGKCRCVLIILLSCSQKVSQLFSIALVNEKLFHIFCKCQFLSLTVAWPPIESNDRKVSFFKKNYLSSIEFAAIIFFVLLDRWGRLLLPEGRLDVYTRKQMLLSKNINLCCVP